MHKKLTVILLTFVAISITPLISHVFAQERQMIAPVGIYNPAMQPFGDTHAYSVTFRGNAEAVVSMKAVFSNHEEATISAMTLQIPRGEVQSISAYQVVREPQCIRYTTNPIVYSPGTDTMSKPFVQECAEYSEPNYFDGYYNGNTKYLKAAAQQNGETISISLPQEIGPEKSGSIVLYYRATGYVKKDTFGAFNYSFETLKADTTIRTMTVGITTDSELKLEGADSQVNYETVAVAPMLAQDSSMGKSIRSPEFDSYYQRIGYGQITKTATDLQPFDSFTVEGRYAKSTYQLYGKKITIGSLLGIGILLLLIAIIHRLVRSLSIKPSTTSKNQPVSTLNSSLMSLGAGVLSSVLASAYTIGLYAFFTALERSSYSQVNIIIVLFSILISCVIYILLVFGPALFIGWKRGVWWGVGTIGITVLLLCMYVGLFVMYQLIAQQPHYPAPIYMNSASPSVEVRGDMK